LILDPKTDLTLPKAPMMVNISKQTGRHDHYEEIEEKEEIIVNPNEELVRPRTKMMVKMDK